MLKAETEESAAQIEGFKAERAALEQQAAGMEIEVATAHNQVLDLKEQLDAETQRNTALVAEEVLLREEVGELDRSVSVLNGKIVMLQKTVAEMEEEKILMEENVSCLVG